MEIYLKDIFLLTKGKNKMNKVPLNAKKVLNEIISKTENGTLEIRPKDINKNETLMNDKSWKSGIDWLMKFRIVKKRVKKKNEVYYSLNPKYMWQALKIGRQNSDLFALQSSRPKEIIDLSTSNGKTTIYGLPEEIFYKSDFENRTLDYSQKETLKFTQGMKTTDLLGKYFGVPPTVETSSNRQASDGEVVDEEVEYYSGLMDKGAKPEDLFKRIITSHRNAMIEFKELGGNIAKYLIELKREYRRKEIAGTFNEKLKELPKNEIKYNLSRFKKGFVGILAHTDHDKDFLGESIFVFYGVGVGGYSRNENPRLFRSFYKFVKSLSSKKKDKILGFLWDVFKENLELYPTRVAFICRGHSIDLFPEGIPYNQKL